MKMSIATSVVDYVKNDNSQCAQRFMATRTFNTSIADAIDAGIVREKYTDARTLYKSLVLTPKGVGIANRFGI